MKTKLIFAILSLLIALTASQTWAGPVGPTDISGVNLVAGGGDVVLYFAGSDASFDSTVSLSSPIYSGELFPNHATSPGTSSGSLGAFAAGTPLLFGLHVNNTGDDWFTGLASGNSDGIVHAAVTSWAADATIPVNGLLIEFEDLSGGGDFDYNDYQFVATGIGTGYVPEPSSLLLLGFGIIALKRLRRR